MSYSVSARNEEFSKIAVIKFFFTVLKKPVICGGDSAGKISRYTKQLNSLTHVY